MTPPTTPVDSSPSSPMAPSGFSSGRLLNTLKTTPPPLTSPPPAPSQPSKENSLLAINLQPLELIFSTPPTSPHPFFDSLEDLPPRTTNLPPPQPSFDSIEHLTNQPPPRPEDLVPFDIEERVLLENELPDSVLQKLVSLLFLTLSLV
nr:hypothetical protein [Tanacetum cinerariifolium]